jgi:antitoxin YefM
MAKSVPRKRQPSNRAKSISLTIPDAKPLGSQQMPSRITYTEACSNFDKIYEEAISTRKAVVVTREGSESVSVIPTAELDSLMETVYLFQSPENAARLLAAIQRAKARTFKPRTVDDLRQEFGLGEEA